MLSIHGLKCHCWRCEDDRREATLNHFRAAIDSAVILRRKSFPILAPIGGVSGTRIGSYRQLRLFHLPPVLQGDHVGIDWRPMEKETREGLAVFRIRMPEPSHYPGPLETIHA
jgi:hypothetical protein